MNVTTAGFHRIVRLLIELLVLSSFAIAGSQFGLLIAIAATAVPAAVWFGTVARGEPGTHRFPVDPRARLAIEIAICAASCFLLWATWSRAASETMMTALVIHYAVTWERVIRLARPHTLQNGVIGGYDAHSHAAD